jgi:hypothetical protein
MTRVLRNLKILEVSGVDRGAGRGTKIVLMKRVDNAGEIEIHRHADGEVEIYPRREAEMPKVDIRKALPLWSALVELIRKREGVTTSKAIDMALADEMGRELFQLAKLCAKVVVRLTMPEGWSMAVV